MFFLFQKREEPINEVRERKILERVLEAEKVMARAKVQEEVGNNWAQCKKQMADMEHEFHSQKEKYGIEIAKLEAKAEALKQLEEAHMALFKEKDRTIETLKQVIKDLTSVNVEVK